MQPDNQILSQPTTKLLLLPHIVTVFPEEIRYKKPSKEEHEYVHCTVSSTTSLVNPDTVMKYTMFPRSENWCTEHVPT